MSRIAALPLEKAEVEFETVMESIQYDENESGKVSVRTSDGRDRIFDDVVVTTPLGWLKSHKDVIRPLEPRLSQAIDSISFGRLEKVRPLLRIKRPNFAD